MTIRFETTANQKIVGELIEDIGHAVLVRVTEGRKNIRGRTMLFSKAHMLTAKFEPARSQSPVRRRRVRR